MWVGQGVIGLVAAALLAGPLAAAELVVKVTDGDGRPVPDAVITMTPDGGAAARWCSATAT